MKIYESLDVETKVQDFGSNILLILTGEEVNINLMHNGLFNFCATNTEIDWQDHCKCCGAVWTTKSKMEQFFRLFYFHHTSDETLKQYKLNNHSSNKNQTNIWWEMCKTFAKEKLNDLMQNHTINFINYYQRRKESYVEPHSMLSDRAEKPDSDFKSQVLEYSFKDRT